MRYVTLIPSSSTSQKLQILREQLLRMFPDPWMVGESIGKSPSSARLKLYDFMWTEECHELPELPEFHLTIGQLPLEEATNYHANH